MKRKIHKLGLLIFAGIIISRAGGFVFRAISLKFLPLSIYGEFVIYLLLLTFLGSLASFGLPVLIASKAGKEISKRKRFTLLQKFSSVLIPISLSISLLLLLLSPLLSTLLKISIETVIFLSFTLPLYTFYNLLLFYFRGTDAKISLVSESIFSALRIFLLIVLFFAGLVFFSPFLSFIISFLVVSTFMIFRLGKIKLLIKEIKNKRSIIASGGIIFLYESFRNLGTGMDRFILSSFFSSTASGIYDSLVLLSLFYIILANSYGIALLSQKSNLKKKLSSSLRVYITFSFAYTIFILLSGKYILHAFKPQLLTAFHAFPYVLLSYFLYGIFVLLIFFLTSFEKYFTALKSTLIFLFFNTALNLYLIPKLEYVGAGIAFLCSLVITLMYTGVKIWKERLF